MKSNRRNSLRTLSLAAVAALPSLAARAQSTWVPSSGTQNWKNATSWDTGKIPTSASNTSLTFGGSGADSYIAVQDIANPFILNHLTLTSNSTGPVVIGSSSTNQASATLRFAGANAAVTHTGTGDVYLNAPISFNANVTFDVQNTGQLILLGDHSQTGGTFGLTKTGTGTLVWGYDGQITPDIAGRGIGNSLAGEIKILQGTILLGSTAGSFLSNTSVVTIAAGATFDFNGNGEDFGSLQGEGTLLQSGASANIGYDNRSTTWSGQIVELDPTTALSKRGTGNWTVATAQPYLSATTVAGGRMTLAQDGAIRQSSQLVLNAGTSFHLDNSAANVNDRLGDEATVMLNGNSELILTGNASAPTSESTGPIGVNGRTTITINPVAGQSAEIRSLGIARMVGSTLLVRGDGLGSTSRLYLGVIPTLVGGGGASGTTTQSILPYVLGDASSTGLGTSLATYNSATGVRPLDASEFANYAASANPNDNARITAPASALAGKTVNSLVVDNSTGNPMAVAGDAAAPLTVSSGAILFTGSSPITLSGFNRLEFGDAEPIISVTNTSPAGATINSPIGGSGGLVKGGTGLLVLGAPNTYTRGTTIDYGTLRVSSDANLGDPSNGVAFNVGTLQLGADLTTARTLTSNTGAIATLDTNGHTLTLTGAFAGAGEFVKTGPGTLVVPTLGSGGEFTFDGGDVRASAPFTSTRTISLTDRTENRFDTNGFDVQLAAMSGPGGFTKIGAGTLIISNANTFTGDVDLRAGTLKVAPVGNSGSFFADSVLTTIAAGATLDMSDNSEAWGGIAGAGTIYTGTATGIDVNVGGDRDTTFSGVIQGAGDLNKAGTHTLTLSGASSFTGQTRVAGGTLALTASVPANANSPLGKSTGAVQLGDTTGTTPATIALVNPGLDFARPINVRTGSTGVASLRADYATGTSKFSGNVTLTKALEVSPTAAAATIELSGILSGAGGLNKTGAGTVVLTRANTYTGATTVSAGTLRVNGSATNSASLTVASGATFEAGATQSLKALTVNATGLAKIAAPGATLTTKALTVAAQGRVDVGTGMLVVDYTGPSPAATIRTALAAGYVNGTWTGPGISSSAIAGTGNTLGYAEASTLLGPTGGTFAGQTLDADALVVRFTLAGDASLDQNVGFADLLTLAKNYNSTVGTWSTGDFDYDGKVAFSDLLALAKNYNRTLTPPSPADLPGATLAFRQDMATAFAAAVPEPSASTVLLAATALTLSRRVRRRAR